MAQVTFPGVYIEEVSSGVHTVTGVATSIAAFFGRASKGRLDEAVRVTSLTDYARNFGPPHPRSDLANSVQHFFDNGGTDCYVVRLAAGAVRANVELRNIGVGVQSHRVLTITAKSPGVWGNGIRLEIDYETSNPDESFNIRIIHEDGGLVVTQEPFTELVMDPESPRFAPTFLTQSSSIIDAALHADLGDPAVAADPINADSPAGFSQSRLVLDISAAGIAATRAMLDAFFQGSGHFEISVNDSRYIDVDLSALDFSTGAPPPNTFPAMIQAELNTKIATQLPGITVACTFDNVGANLRVLRLTSNTGRTTSVRVRRARDLDMATDLLLGIDQGGIEVVRFSNQRPVFTGSAYIGGRGFGDIANPAAANSVNALATMPQNPAVGIGSITVNATTVAVPNVQTVGPGALWFQDANGGSDGVREKLRIIATTLNADATFSLNFQASLWGYHLAIVRRAPSINDTATVTSAPTAFLGNGTLANTARYALGIGGTGAFQLVPGVAGNDGTVPGVAEYMGSEPLRTGFHALDGVDLFNLMVLPGDRDLTEAVYVQLLSPAAIYCASRRAVLLVDAPESWSANGLLNTDASKVSVLRSAVGARDNAAVFYPRIRYSDRGVLKYIGPSGMIAGIMARTDSTRGVWKAPAGLDATMRGALDLEVVLTDRQNGILNPLGVNSIRRFPAGTVNWGARMMGGFDNGSTDWKYIPVRRTALFLEESLYRGTQWVVFEPNDEPLYANIRKNLSAFMMGLFRQGAFQGSTPAQAFFVKCDNETTTQNDRNLGIVNILVGFAPLKPAEFVVIRIQQIAGDLV